MIVKDIAGFRVGCFGSRAHDLIGQIGFVCSLQAPLPPLHGQPARRSYLAEVCREPRRISVRQACQGLNVSVCVIKLSDAAEVAAGFGGPAGHRVLERKK